MLPFRACFVVFLLAAVHSVHVFAVEEALSFDTNSVLSQASANKIRKKAFKTAKNSFLTLTNTANAESSCRWNVLTNSCDVGYGVLAKLLGKSSNRYAKFVAKFAECLAATDGKACAAIADCLWDTDTFTCRFVDFYTGHEDSPCISDADSTIHAIVADELCAVHKTQLSCYKDPSCEWNQDELFCETDFFTFWIGVPFSQLEEASNAVILYKVAEMKALFAISFDFASEDFRYEDILTWKVPKTSCPDWSDPMVCTYVDGILTNIAMSFYCATRYVGQQQQMGCIQDPLCIFDDQTACRQPDESFGPGVLKGIKDIVAQYVKAPLDRKILNQLLDCSAIYQKGACSDPCKWIMNEYGDGECEIQDKWIAQILATSGGDSDDIICKFARDQTAAGCIGTEDFYVCATNPNCSLQFSGECWVSVDFQAKQLTKADTSLKKPFDELTAACSSRKTEEQCLGDA